MPDAPPPAPAQSPPTTLSRIGQGARVAGIALVSLGLAFGGWLLITSQLVVSSAHQRNWQGLAVIANALESWPRDLTVSAERQFSSAKQDASGEKSATAPATDLGEVIFHYSICLEKDAGSAAFFEPGQRPEETTRFIVSRPLNDDKKVCFRAAVPLDRVVALDRTASGFSNVLIVAPDASVIEQVGDASLPVTKLSDLAPVLRFAKDAVVAIDKTSSAGISTANTNVGKLDTSPLDSNAGVSTIRIADVSYFAYVRPFTLSGKGQTCPGPADTKAPQTGTTLPSPPPLPDAKRPCTLYAVGLMPTQALREAWFKPPPSAFTAFGLALLLVLALLPLLRLVLIGGNESVSRLHVIAIVFGVQAAVAIATLACLFAYETSGERKGATDEARMAVQSLAAHTGEEMSHALDQARTCRTVKQSAGGTGSTETGRIEKAGIFSNEPGEKAGIAPEKVSCGSPMPSSTDVGARRYFLAVGSAGSMMLDGRPYVVDQVRSQLDGRRLTVIAMRTGGGVLVTTTTLRSLVSPILPNPQQFLVVDGGDPALPVLFHSQPERAGVENFADHGRVRPDIVQVVMELALQHGHPAPVTFSTTYDGRSTHFSAARIPGTRWVVMVYHRFDEIDAIAARTTFWALAAWASIALVLALLGVGALLVLRRPWRRLWPFEVASKTYRCATWWMLGGAVVEIVPAAIGCHYAVPLALLISVLLVVGCCVKLLGISPTDAPLTVLTERRYRYLVLATLACASMAPMIALWSDARAFNRDTVDAERVEAVRKSATQWIDQQRVLPASTSPTDPTGGAWPGVRIRGGEIELPAAHQSFIGTLFRVATGFRPEPAAACHAQGLDGIWSCWHSRDWVRAHASSDNGLETIGVRPHAMPFEPSGLAWLGLLLLAAALAILVRCAVYYGLWSLTGFGIPLNSVKWPSLVLGTPTSPGAKGLPLTRRTLLVAPQQIVRDAVSAGTSISFNFASLLPLSNDALTAVIDADGQPTIKPKWCKMGYSLPRLVVCGLELVIRDQARRRAALSYLENAVAALSGPGACLAQVIVIAEMSPLERILDAYEAPDTADTAAVAAREDLRWARLFQDFTTFSFAPIDKISSARLEREFGSAKSPARLLVEELRWLPGNVIDGAIANEKTIRVRGALYPLPASRYRAFYTRKVITWARSVAPCTEAAAIDYLRSNLIEYYQQCWASSSLAERVVLDAIARGCYVNMRKAVALQSLVRRGLVILDPAPRLMSRSFALFIRQAERPDTLENWRARQPRSAWALARLPIAVLLPAAVILFAIAAVESGQDLAALIPLLAAGAPAMLGLVFRGGRPAL